MRWSAEQTGMEETGVNVQLRERRISREAEEGKDKERGLVC